MVKLFLDLPEILPARSLSRKNADIGTVEKKCACMTDPIPKSLEEVHASVETRKRSFFRRLFAFMGPAYLIAVGYMDPGNWATDIAGGSQFGYALIWVLLMSNLMALLLQSLSTRLGIVSGRDLAQASKETYSRPVNFVLYLLAEIAIAATDLAEVLGMAIGLQLLFGLPLLWGVLLTFFDTFLLLFFIHRGMRVMEAFILALIGIIGLAFLMEMFLAKPDLGELAAGFVPSLPNDRALFIAIGIIGATVMPHNLYLHSSLVQSRKFTHNLAETKGALRFNFVDSAIALNLAFLVNAAILVLAAATFYKAGMYNVSEIQDAHRFLQPLLGSQLAPIFFAIALIAAGQSSTLTGTLAGQVVMEGYLNLRIQPWIRRLLTRTLAIGPAVLAIVFLGEEVTGKMLILSQVILSLQLGFAIIPLIHFVSNRRRMGKLAIGPIVKVLSWLTAIIIVGLNVKLVVEEITSWIAVSPPPPPCTCRSFRWPSAPPDYCCTSRSPPSSNPCWWKPGRTCTRSPAASMSSKKRPSGGSPSRSTSATSTSGRSAMPSRWARPIRSINSSMS